MKPFDLDGAPNPRRVLREKNALGLLPVLGLDDGTTLGDTAARARLSPGSRSRR